MIKRKVQVRQGNGTIVEDIFRKLWREAIGNFAPVFCTYKGKRRLIESDNLHLDDPGRYTKKDHLETMFIRPRGEDGQVVATWEEAK